MSSNIEFTSFFVIDMNKNKNEVLEWDISDQRYDYNHSEAKSSLKIKCYTECEPKVIIFYIFLQEISKDNTNLS